MKIVIRIVIAVVVLAGGGAIYNAMHPGAKSCNSLVDTVNSAIDVFNKSSSAADIPKVVSKFTDTSAQLRKDADDFKAPFDADARTAAGDLDAIVKAFNDKSESAVQSGIDKYNADVSKANADCKSAR